MNLLEMSFSASVMILIVLLVRIVGKKYISKTVIITLWNLVLVRALLPFQIPLGNVPIFKQICNKLIVSEIPKQLVSMQFDEYAIGNVSANIIKETEKTGGNLQPEEYLLVLWLVGTVCVLINFARVYRKEHRVLKTCVPTQNETAERLIRNLKLHRKVRLYEGGAFIAPVTYGVLHPKIVIPQNINEISRVDMRNMIAHELVHIQRYDVAKRFFMIAALCIHWFNPLIWIMYHCYRADQEMACDEGVLSNMAGEGIKNYVYTMIKMASGGRMLWSTTGFVGKSAERKRILAAMNQKRMGKGSILAAVILCLCLALPFLSFTQAKGNVDMGISGIPGEVGALPLERLEAVKKEQELLSPLYEGEIQAPSTENFDYKAVLQDITDNYNDLSQPFTEDQIRALNIQNHIILAEIYKERQDRGDKLDPMELWILSEFYEYNE